MAKKRIPKTSVFIACEGSNTEPLYFESIKEIQEEDDFYPYSITVYPDKEIDVNPKSDAIGLVNVAIDRKDEFDNLWVVYDKDGYTKHSEALELAKENNINVAFSSVAFETWILLHFERCVNPYSKSAELIENKFHNNETYLKNYAKSGDYNVFPLINDRLHVALENSTWLRSFLNKKEPGYAYLIANPYTDIDELIKILFQHELTYEHNYLGETTAFKGIKVEFNKVENVIKLKIRNNRNISIVTNQFEIFDTKKSKIKVQNIVVNSNDFIELELIEADENLIIYLEFEKLRLEVDCVIKQ
jgi:hypothetical protein